jgi:hypothetical protein
MTKQISITKEEYIKVAEQTDKAGMDLMLEKSEGYSVGDDFLSMENRIAGLTNTTPEFVSMILACKHIASLFILLEKPGVLNLVKWQERVRDGTNLLKIASCFVEKRLRNEE